MAKLSNAQRRVLTMANIMGPSSHIRVSRDATLFAMAERGLIECTSTGGKYWFISLTETGQAALKEPS